MLEIKIQDFPSYRHIPKQMQLMTVLSAYICIYDCGVKILFDRNVLNPFINNRGFSFDRDQVLRR